MPLSWNEAFPQWSHGVGLPARWHAVLGPGPIDDAELAFACDVEALPKIELHVHTEAAVGESFYSALNAKHVLYPDENLPALRAPFATLHDFVLAWIDNTKLLRDVEAFEDLVVDFVRAQAEQNIVYTEAHVSPSDFSYGRERSPRGALPFPIVALLHAYARGARRAAELFPHVFVRFIVDALWFASEPEYSRMLAALAEVIALPEAQDPRGGCYFVAVGLGGREASERAVEILPFINGARALGLGIDVHSGENTTAREHRHSVETLLPDRVGHGIQGAAAGFFFPGHIATCPLSNLLTGSWTEDLSRHPVAAMAEKGHSFSIGSDDPLLFRTTLTLEFVALRRVFGFGHDFVALARANALAACFDKETARAALGASVRVGQPLA